jgi:DNA-directed RNA polymerase subunit RPC12/RpoP
MTGQFVSLKCVNCGGKLEVYDNVEGFACGYCGSEMAVQRRGGTIALTAVTEAVRQVQAGTDRTAGELAIVRLEREWAALSSRLAMMPRPPTPLGTLAYRSLVLFGITFVGLIMAVGVFASEEIPNGPSDVIGVSIIVGSILFAVWIAFFKARATPSSLLQQRRAAIESRIAEIESELIQNRAIVSQRVASVPGVRRCVGCGTEISMLAKHCNKCGVGAKGIS